MVIKSFEASHDVVFNSLILTLQDLGYFLRYADISAGKVSAKSPPNPSPFLSFLTGLVHIEHTEAAAFLHELQGRTHIGLDFSSNNSSASSQDETMHNFSSELPALVFELIEYKIAELLTQQEGPTHPIRENVYKADFANKTLEK